MNLLLLLPNDVVAGDGSVQISDHRTDHIRDVLRSQVGDRLRVGRLGGDLGVGVITALDDEGVRLDVDLHQSPPPRLRFDIVLALPRPKMLRRVLRTVAEFGVEHLHLINSARVGRVLADLLLRQEKVHDALRVRACQRYRDAARVSAQTVPTVR